MWVCPPSIRPGDQYILTPPKVLLSDQVLPDRKIPLTPISNDDVRLFENEIDVPSSLLFCDHVKEPSKTRHFVDSTEEGDLECPLRYT